jgi:hypothetical protein
MFNKISTDFGERLKTLVYGQQIAPSAGVKPFGPRPVPQPLGEDVVIREIVITADAWPSSFNPSTGYIHGYLADDESQSDLWPYIRLTQPLGVLRAAGSFMAASQAWAVQVGSLWYILCGEFGTRFKAKVKTADIAPDGTNAVTVYWQNANSGTASLISSGHDVNAINRLTRTVAKNQYVEIEFDPIDYGWWIIGVDDPVFLADFELAANHAPSDATTDAYRVTFSGGSPTTDTSATFKVRDPHAQFRGRGRNGSTPGSRGKAQWVEDGTSSGYQIIEMQSPAMMLKYTVSGAVAASATTVPASTTPTMIQPDGALYMIGAESGGSPTIYKDTDFSIPAGFTGYAVWNKSAGRYEALPVSTANVQIRYGNGGGHVLEYSTDGGATWATILTAVSANPITQNSVDGAAKQLKSATTQIFVFSAGSQGTAAAWHTGDSC